MPDSTAPEPVSPEVGSPATWHAAKPATLVEPTWWPAAVGFSVALIAWGLITVNIVLAVGAVAFAVSVAGWIGELRHERKHP